MPTLSAKPIQLDLHKTTCLSFREDSFIVSFGHARNFHDIDGKGSERYLEWLKIKIDKNPSSAVHIWEGNEIIGQVELSSLRDDPTCGYVNLYYLIPSKRGQGIGSFLDNYAMEYFKSQGIHKVRLSVSPQNKQAVAFYQKLRWKDLGRRPDAPEVHFMEKMIN